MIGSKPLSPKEIKAMLGELTCLRDKALFILGCKSGFRISELLSLTLNDVTQYGHIKDSITVNARRMKGQMRSRTVVIHKDAKEALSVYLGVFLGQGPDRLFPVSRQHAWRQIKDAAFRAKVEGRVSTHSMRKTFAKHVYYALEKDLINTQRALGHTSVSSTVSYLSFDQDAINQAILKD